MAPRELKFRAMQSQFTVLAYWSWLVLALVWLPGYFLSKSTSTVPNLALQIPATALLVISFVFLLDPWMRFLNLPITPQDTPFGIVGLALDLAGVGFAIWARLILGANWSGIVVTAKQGHELVQTGPYAIVRHPIYAGILLAMIGTALTEGRLASYIGLLAGFVAIMIRVGIEEQLMSRHFPTTYEAYQRRTSKLVPFVW
jgi:protein-S-isoprenylcysteine O-methyltransferase Ste14